MTLENAPSDSVHQAWRYTAYSKEYFEHNDILAYLQDKAMENREKWFDAYGHGRMTEVLNVLSGNTKP